MSEMIQWILEMKVQDGQAAIVQPLIDEMVDDTLAKEPGTLTYEYYMTPGKTHCTAIERYADNAAVMAHLANFSAKYAERFMATFSPIRFTVFGDANGEVRAALAGLGATHQALAAGFHR